MDNVVVLTGVLETLRPFLVEIFQVLLGAGVTFVGTQVMRFFNFQLTEQQWKVVHSTAEAAAGKIWAAAEPSIATAKIHVGSSQVAFVAQTALDLIPRAVKATGITSEQFAELIVSKIGVLQSRATTPVAAAAIEKAAA